MSLQDTIAQLRDICARALHLATDHHKSGSHYGHTALARIHSILVSYSVLDQLLPLVLSQCETCFRLQRATASKIGATCSTLAHAKLEASSALGQLTSVIDELRTRPSPVQPPADASNTSSLGSTPFPYCGDFLNLEAITELTVRSQSLIHQLDVAYGAYHSTSDGIATQCEALMQQLKADRALMHRTRDELRSTAESVSADVAFLSDTVLSLASIYDNLTAMAVSATSSSLSQFQLQSSATSLLSASAMMSSSASMQPAVAKLSDMKRRIEALAASLKQTAETTKRLREVQFNAAHQVADDVKLHLQVGNERLQEWKNQIVEMTMSEAQAALLDDCASTVTEMRDLEEWYRSYASACEEVPHEILRRRREIARANRLLEQMRTELEKLVRGEEEKRAQFHQFYGQYLPSNFCPSLEESIPALRVDPPRWETALPEVPTADSVHSISSMYR
jgi:hypothetical protein